MGAPHLTIPQMFRGPEPEGGPPASPSREDEALVASLMEEQRHRNLEEDAEWDLEVEVLESSGEEEGDHPPPDPKTPPPTRP